MLSIEESERPSYEEMISFDYEKIKIKLKTPRSMKYQRFQGILENP